MIKLNEAAYIIGSLGGRPGKHKLAGFWRGGIDLSQITFDSSIITFDSTLVTWDS